MIQFFFHTSHVSHISSRILNFFVQIIISYSCILSLCSFFLISVSDSIFFFFIATSYVLHISSRIFNSSHYSHQMKTKSPVTDSGMLQILCFHKFRVKKIIQHTYLCASCRGVLESLALRMPCW